MFTLSKIVKQVIFRPLLKRLSDLWSSRSKSLDLFYSPFRAQYLFGCVSYHCYADDIQICVFVKPVELSHLVTLHNCLNCTLWSF